MVEATLNRVLSSRTCPRSLVGDHGTLAHNTANMLPALKCQPLYFGWTPKEVTRDSSPFFKGRIGRPWAWLS